MTLYTNTVPKIQVCLLLLFLFIIPLKAQDNSPIRFKTVVIDAGHGGKDSGAVGKLSQEKNIVLSIALKVGAYIKENMPDVEVVYTRSTDVFVPLDERAEIANKAKADLFVSIHGNSISNPKIYGAETFVLGLHRSEENLEVAKKENSVIILEDDYTTKYEGFDPTQPESYIIFELMQNVYLDQSIAVASLVQNQFEQRVGRHNRGVKQAGFLVLRKTSMPGILVEVGFLSNPKEEKYMMSEDGQSYIASGIFRAIRDYRDRFEARNNISVSSPALKSDHAKQSDSALDDSKKEKKASKILFRVQIASSSQKVSNEYGVLALFNDVWMYQENNMYKYTTGSSSSYKEICDILAEVRKKVPDSFIVAFDGSERVPVSSVE
ncbi:N-acetylmuramoyl-L-alanine amidase family protein [Geofilum sp. OHC36d9]|uniref:N-acetylmuramoyl-L-alanine amidase family protein n=1 Tax=Geofilum sp. OHC36d9 TaxID=3458413 RepID=UPI0040341D1C